MKKINYLIAKYLGAFLYPLNKQGKEHRNPRIIKNVLENDKKYGRTR